jgi:hypothetical protein
LDDGYTRLSEKVKQEMVEVDCFPVEAVWQVGGESDEGLLVTHAICVDFISSQRKLSCAIDLQSFCLPFLRFNSHEATGLVRAKR